MISVTHIRASHFKLSSTDTITACSTGQQYEDIRINIIAAARFGSPVSSPHLYAHRQIIGGLLLRHHPAAGSSLSIEGKNCYLKGRVYAVL
jgi:hypothetical protein